MFDISEELKKLPKTPGVYMHKDSLGEVIYVGKAVNLRNRVSSYFRKTSQADPKVRAMVSNIAEFEYISCATEMEALLLECNLIKKYMPRYNILLKDDKSYPFIEVTTNEEFPRVISTRRLRRDGNRYFGPYTDADNKKYSLFPFKGAINAETNGKFGTLLKFQVIEELNKIDTDLFKKNIDDMKNYSSHYLI